MTATGKERSVTVTEEEAEALHPWAATRVQAAQRGRKARKRFKDEWGAELAMRKEAPATREQRLRGEAAAAKLQARQRGRAARARARMRGKVSLVRLAGVASAGRSTLA